MKNTTEIKEEMEKKIEGLINSILSPKINPNVRERVFEIFNELKKEITLYGLLDIALLLFFVIKYENLLLRENT